MFSSLTISFIVAASVFAWSYNKFMRTTGNNTQKAITGGATVAIMAFAATILALYFIDNFLINEVNFL